MIKTILVHTNYSAACCPKTSERMKPGVRYTIDIEKIKDNKIWYFLNRPRVINTIPLPEISFVGDRHHFINLDSITYLHVNCFVRSRRLKIFSS